MVRKGGYEWLVKVTGVCVWVRMDAYGCNAVGEDKKQARKDIHGSNAHDFPASMAGKFPKIHGWARGGTEGYWRSNRVTGGFAAMYWCIKHNIMYIKRHVGTQGCLWRQFRHALHAGEKRQTTKTEQQWAWSWTGIYEWGIVLHMWWGNLLKKREEKGTLGYRGSRTTGFWNTQLPRQLYVTSAPA